MKVCLVTDSEVSLLKEDFYEVNGVVLKCNSRDARWREYSESLRKWRPVWRP